MDILNKPPGVAPNPGLLPESGALPRLAERKRVPMSVPRQKLQVAEIPGFHLHWALESRLPSYLQAGYDFVKSDEVHLNQQSVGTDSTISGNQDLGTNVRIVAGTGVDGRPEFLVLMKLPLEYFRQDQRELEERNATILQAIFRGEKILGPEGNSTDATQRYVDMERTTYQNQMRPLFQRPTRKAK